VATEGDGGGEGDCGSKVKGDGGQEVGGGDVCMGGRDVADVTGW
jgi:hypothetical protein